MIIPFLFFLITNSYAMQALPTKAPEPRDNPTTLEKIELGRKLFFDPRLSKAGNISCNSCHNVMAGGDDMRASSIGHEGKIGNRSAPTVWNAAFLSSQFWDGRAATLEEQAKGPLTNPIEMAMENHDVVVDRIQMIPGYLQDFKRAFQQEKISIDNVAKAIAAYERTLITPNSRFDKYIKGSTLAFTASEKRGFELFQSVGCAACHSGPNFSGPGYQKFPLIPDPEIEKRYGFTQDTGRFSVTKNENDKHFWRVPTLRNIAITAPYFHNGSVKTLNEAVRVMAKLQLGRKLTDLEADDLTAFLGTLTGPFPKQTLPQLPQIAGKAIIE